MTQESPKQPHSTTTAHDEIDLTEPQGAALDAALNKTTDDEIRASIEWLDKIEKEKPSNGRQPQH